MFHLGRDDVPFGGIRPQRRRDGDVVALRRARGENHIHRVRANQLRHLFAGREDDVGTSSAGPRPNAVRPYGLPQSVVRYGIIASSTSGRIGVVALWSR